KRLHRQPELAPGRLTIGFDEGQLGEPRLTEGDPTRFVDGREAIERLTEMGPGGVQPPRTSFDVAQRHQIDRQVVLGRAQAGLRQNPTRRLMIIVTSTGWWALHQSTAARRSSIWLRISSTTSGVHHDRSVLAAGSSARA